MGGSFLVGSSAAAVPIRSGKALLLPLLDMPLFIISFKHGWDWKSRISVTHYVRSSYDIHRQSPFCGNPSRSCRYPTDAQIRCAFSSREFTDFTGVVKCLLSSAWQVLCNDPPRFKASQAPKSDASSVLSTCG